MRNWFVPVGDPEPFCHACRLNHMIPDLSAPENWPLWFRRGHRVGSTGTCRVCAQTSVPVKRDIRDDFGHALSDEARPVTGHR